MRVAPTEGPVDLHGHTLVVPGIGGLAHLGELAVDALVASLKLNRVALVHSRHLLPVAMSSAWEVPGAGERGALKLTTAAELYQSTCAPRLTVLQLRSPVAEGRRCALARELLMWARAEGAAELLVLASCSSHVKLDADIMAATDLRYVRVPSASMDGAGLGLGQDVLPLGHGIPKALDGEGSLAAVRQLLRGSGLARPLLQLAAEEAAGGSPGAAQAPPSILCLMGLTSDVLSWPLLEQLTRAACARLVERGIAPSGSSFLPPPSWHFHAQLTATPQRLWG